MQELTLNKAFLNQKDYDYIDLTYSQLVDDDSSASRLNTKGESKLKHRKCFLNAMNTTVSAIYLDEIYKFMKN